RQDVPFGAECVVSAADGVTPVDPVGRTRNARLDCCRNYAPDVEVGPALFEGGRGKQRVDQPTSVLLEFATLCLGVSIAQNQQIDLVGRIAVHFELQDRTL